MTYQEWVTASLSILGMAITILGVVIAAVALWGYRGIKNEAIRLAKDAATDAVKGFLSDENVRGKLKLLVDEKVREEADQLYADHALIDPPVQGADGPPDEIGSQYPKDEEGREYSL